MWLVNIFDNQGGSSDFSSSYKKADIPHPHPSRYMPNYVSGNTDVDQTAREKKTYMLG
jgi:hypothetical protein